MKAKINRLMISGMIILISVLCSCSCSDSSVFIVDEGIANFSFEYPDTFAEPILDLSSTTLGMTDVYICMAPVEECDIYAQINIYRKDEYLISATRQLEDFLNIYGPKLPCFNLLERASFSNDVITGEKIRYTWKGYKPEIETLGPFDSPEEVEAVLDDMLGDTIEATSVYFDHGEFYVVITAQSLSELIEQAESTLDLILRTFKFLD